MFFKSKLALIAAAAFALNTTSVQADPNTVLANICTIVKSDDKGQLRKKMKAMKADYRMDLRHYYQDISCGGLTLIQHAVKNDAVNAGKFIIKKMSKKDLAAPTSNGGTELQWITANGFDGSALKAALEKRIG